MIQQLENAISKLSELSETEQEAIAQMIMTTIENKKSSVNAWDTLKEMAGSISLENPENSENNDPLAELRNSDFIGCFSDEPNLAEKSEQINQNLSKIYPQNLKVIAEFVEFIKQKQEINISETTLLSESSLAKDWLTEEEDNAWQNL